MSLHRKILAVFLSAVMIFCTVYTYALVASAETQYANITGTSVRLRKEPTTKSDEIVRLSKVKVQVNFSVEGEEASSGNGTTWYNVTTLDGENTGYIYGYYLKIIQPAPVPFVNPDFESQLATFPESYRSALTQLHKDYPNWNFVADNIDMTIDEFIDIESNTLNRKQVPKSNCNAYKTMMSGAFDWSTNKFNEANGGWCSASRQIIAYYVDPRNFLDTKQAFVFLDQGYDATTQNKEGLKAAYSGTFLGNGYDVDVDGTVSEDEKDAYFNDLMEAAEKSYVNPYVLASKITVEQGKGNSRLISGTCEEFGAQLKGYYNFLNIGASGSTDDDVVKNGLTRAKENGWNTPRKSIIGGAVKYADNYINNGQRTNYYMDYNCVYYKSSKLQIQHQYAQNVSDAVAKGTWLQKAYDGNVSIPLVFRIPVFKSMPSKPYAKPAVSDNYNNFYILDFKADGLNTPFDKYKYNYSFSVSGDKTVFVKLHGSAKLQKTSYNLSAGLNVINVTVIAETGYTNTYDFSVKAEKAGTLTLTTQEIVPPQEPEEPPEPETPEEPQEPDPPRAKGDVNGDSLIDVMDFALIRLHILNKKTITSADFQYSDIDGNGAVDVMDFALVRLHILGKKTID